eukprot:TRINITY_DN443_c0_g5_i1.p1 TRINITY_DN443_c0_g5~~TRINITY_DN443_c0_g5_i1.p1  ORF type:complete len:431 (+),score=120.73 TRINITY_DN443_c0_g5_i1:66-1295(+)
MEETEAPGEDLLFVGWDSDGDDAGDSGGEIEVGESDSDDYDDEDDDDSTNTTVGGDGDGGDGVAETATAHTGDGHMQQPKLLRPKKKELIKTRENKTYWRQKRKRRRARAKLAKQNLKQQQQQQQQLQTAATLTSTSEDTPSSTTTTTTTTATERPPRKIRAKDLKGTTYTPHKPCVVFDLSYAGHEHSEKEVRSVVSQINQSYGTLRRASRPLECHLSSLTGRFASVFAEHEGFPLWQFEKHPEHFTEWIPAEELDRVIYLSPDAPDALESVDKTNYYVIGGIADINIKKGLSYTNARQYGIRTARLPISEYAIDIRRKVLNVNHVLSILMHVAETGDWREAFNLHIPARKVYHRTYDPKPRRERTSHSQQQEQQQQQPQQQKQQQPRAHAHATAPRPQHAHVAASQL